MTHFKARYHFPVVIKGNTFLWPVSKKEGFFPTGKLIYSVPHYNMHFVCAHIRDLNKESYLAGKRGVS